MSDKRLKPCPFCGCKDVCLYVKKHLGHPIEILGCKYWYAECLNCDARTGDCFDGDADIYGYKDGEEAAIKMWNLRENKT